MKNLHLTIFCFLIVLLRPLAAIDPLIENLKNDHDGTFQSKRENYSILISPTLELYNDGISALNQAVESNIDDKSRNRLQWFVGFNFFSISSKLDDITAQQATDALINAMRSEDDPRQLAHLYSFAGNVDHPTMYAFFDELSESSDEVTKIAGRKYKATMDNRHANSPIQLRAFKEVPNKNTAIGSVSDSIKQQENNTDPERRIGGKPSKAKEDHAIAVASNGYSLTAFLVSALLFFAFGVGLAYFHSKSSPSE